MELSAFVRFIKRWLTSITHASSCLTTVGVIVECLFVNLVSATWCLRESNWQSFSTKEWLSVWELGCFEEDCFLGVLLSDDLVGFLSHWEQFLPVELGWLSEEALFLIEVCRPRLIEDIITDDIRILAKLFRHYLPVCEELILEAVFVRIEGCESGRNLWSSVHVLEAMLLALG